MWDVLGAGARSRVYEWTAFKALVASAILTPSLCLPGVSQQHTSHPWCCIRATNEPEQVTTQGVGNASRRISGVVQAVRHNRVKCASQRQFLKGSPYSGCKIPITGRSRELKYSLLCKQNYFYVYIWIHYCVHIFISFLLQSAWTFVVFLSTIVHFIGKWKHCNKLDI